MGSIVGNLSKLWLDPEFKSEGVDIDPIKIPLIDSMFRMIFRGFLMSLIGIWYDQKFTAKTSWIQFF